MRGGPDRGGASQTTNTGRIEDKTNGLIPIVTPGEWAAFLAETRDGEFSQP
ncbi:MAG: hypothetical protein ACRDRI_16560 [Pseudonocardiaceae bacterium]